MKLEHQLTSFELSCKLKELGVKQESLFYHVFMPEKKISKGGEYFKRKAEWKLLITFVLKRLSGNETISAFTVAELGEMLPHFCSSYTVPTGAVCKQLAGDSEEADTEADARATMLIYLLENKLIQL